MYPSYSMQMNRSIPVINAGRYYQQLTQQKGGSQPQSLKIKDLNMINATRNLGRNTNAIQKTNHLTRNVSESILLENKMLEKNRNRQNNENRPPNNKQCYRLITENSYKLQNSSTNIINTAFGKQKNPNCNFQTKRVCDSNKGQFKQLSEKKENIRYNNVNMPFNQTFNTFKREDFVIIKKLGQGKFGKVFMAKQVNTGMVVAIKILQKTRIVQSGLMIQFIRQLKIQSFLNNPGLITLYGIFHDKKYVYAVMQLGCDGHLFKIIQKQFSSEQTASFIAKNLLQTVGYMHQQKIIHRDIKPQNIVLIHGTVKLCDFGWVVDRKYQLRQTFCGTPLYLSPELLTGEPYDQKIDLWAIGILVYQLCIGKSPFNIEKKKDIGNIITEQVNFPLKPKVSQEFKEFIITILRKNPKDRLSHRELLKLQFINKYQGLQTCEELCNRIFE